MQFRFSQLQALPPPIEIRGFRAEGESMNETVDLRALAKADLADWYDLCVVQPFIKTCHDRGITDVDEINVLFNKMIQQHMAWNEKRSGPLPPITSLNIV